LIFLAAHGCHNLVAWAQNIVILNCTGHWHSDSPPNTQLVITKLLKARPGSRGKDLLQPRLPDWRLTYLRDCRLKNDALGHILVPKSPRILVLALLILL
jgi:hypothetical protein